VPHEAKKFLLPKLKAKPVRTASGVSFKIVKFQRISVTFYFCFRSQLLL
jgi:histone acetyltransferase (RNA polymerase elongator complex component)